MQPYVGTQAYMGTSQTVPLLSIIIILLLGSSNPLYCLESTDRLLLAGGNDGLKVWKWKAIKKV